MTVRLLGSGDESAFIMESGEWQGLASDLGEGAAKTARGCSVWPVG